jgi:lysophospholipase L1-like esterase
MIFASFVRLNSEPFANRRSELSLRKQLFYHIWIIVFGLLLSSIVEAKPWRIMAVGNSITKGVGSTDEYGFRKKLYSGLTNAGIQFQMVGPDGEPFNAYFKPGADIEDFLPGGEKPISQALMNNYQPNMILLHLGTNNIQNNDESLKDAKRELLQLLRELTKYTDGTLGSYLERIILCKIPPKKIADNASPYVDLFNAYIDELFFERPAGVARNKITVCNTPINVADLVDGIHPDDYGYAKIAGDFVDIIRGLSAASDNYAPGRIAWGPSRAIDGETALLQWRATGDDGNFGKANLYELRYATYELTAENFNTGVLVSLGKTKNVFEDEQAQIDKLTPGITYFFGLRAYDEWNNAGPLNFFSLEMPAATKNEFCDDFIDTELTNWSYDPDYTVMDECLSNTNSATGWNALAVYQNGSYTANSKSVTVTLTWSDIADFNGMEGTGIAMMLNDPSSENADGYLVKISIDEGKATGVSLFKLTTNYGVVTLQYLDSEGVQADPNAPAIPQGSNLKVKYSLSYTDGYTFSVYLNDIPLGIVTDPDMEMGQADQLYSGLMLYGGSENDIDQYCIEVPPLDPHHLVKYGGDGQSGPVTKSPPEFIKVKAEDINTLGVPNVVVEFSTVQGNGFLSTDSIADQFTGDIWLEAEDGFLDIYSKNADGNASGSQYISVPTGIGELYNQGEALYNVYVPKNGIYNVWLRLITPSDKQNSLYLDIDGNTVEWSPINVTTSWAWFQKYAFRMDKGLVQFKIKNREPGTRVDKILLTTNAYGSIPGTGGSPLRFSNVTDGLGIAYTRVTFPERADSLKVRAFASTVPNDNEQVFTVYAEALEPASMVYASARDTIVKAGDLINLQVQLQDQYGNKCQSYPVLFTVVSGDGHFAADTVSTEVSSDANGTASAKLRMGFISDVTIVRATLPEEPDIAALEFTIRKGEGPTEIIKLPEGDLQAAPVNSELAAPLRVRVVNAQGEPFANFPVPFEIISGDGLINGQYKSLVDTTDQNGIASIRLTAGKVAGDSINVIKIDVALLNAPLYFYAHGLAGQARGLLKIHGDNQQRSAGRTFIDSLVVKVVDEYGNGKPGYSVRFSDQFTDGHFEGQQQVTRETDANGFVSVYYTAGRATGSRNITVEGVPQLPDGQVTFSLTVLPPNASQIVIVSGNKKRYEVNSIVTDPLKVRVLDPFGDFVANVDVWFKVLQGNGKLNGLDSMQLQTNSNGEAVVTSFRLGTEAGFLNNEIVVYLQDKTVKPVLFQLTGDPGAAYIMEVLGDTTFYAQPGQEGIQLGVKVRDAFNNPRPGHKVTFTTEGSGSFIDDKSYVDTFTDNNGNAIVEYTMGKNPLFEEKISAISFRPNVSGAHLLGSPAQFHGQYLPGEVFRLIKISGDMTQSVDVMNTLGQPFVVEAQDLYELPVPNLELVFKVVSGGGSIGLNEEVIVKTDNNGRASVMLTVGRKAGEHNQIVRVSVKNNADVASVQFSASARAGNADLLVVNGDTAWTGSVDMNLSPTVMITDRYENPKPGYPVFFEIIQGEGKVNGQDTLTLFTNNNGIARVSWTLGNQPDSNRVKVTAEMANGEHLRHSPVIFSAYTKSANPVYMILQSAQKDTGVIGQPLHQPIRVLITDYYNNPVPNHRVDINAISFSRTAHIENTAPSETAYIMTDPNGIATARLILGNAAEKVWVHIRSSFNGQPLINKNESSSVITVTVESLPTFAYKATLSGDSLITAAAGSTVQVEVQIEDRNGQPLTLPHPVYFSVQDQESTLGQDGNKFQIQNSNNGTAKILWNLGTTAGEKTNQMRIQVKNNEKDVVNSPLIVWASLFSGKPNNIKSNLTATGPVLANGTSQSKVTVELKDQYGNPVAGKIVYLQISGEGNTVHQPSEATNAEGRATGYIKSTKAGSKTVHARISDSPSFDISTQVDFYSDDPRNLVVVAGDKQSGNRGTILPDPFVIKVEDSNHNPVRDIALQFTISQGQGQFQENGATSFMTTTDSAGLGRAFLILGTENNSATYVRVTSPHPNLQGLVQTFLAYAIDGEPAELQLSSESPLEGTVGDTLSKPLQVRVVDHNGHPVYDVQVNFEPLSADADIIQPQPVKSDRNGMAHATYRLGSKAGSQKVQVKLATADSLEITVTGMPAAPADIVASSGTPQYCTVKQQLQLPFRAMIIDAFGNPIPGIKVNFQMIDGNGGRFVGADTVLTNSSGVAAVYFIAGEKAGDYIVRAKSPSLISRSALFRCIARADIASTIQIIDGNNQLMTAGRQLLDPLKVLIRDQYGNPVPDFVVNFYPYQGSVLQSADTTNDHGIAQCTWLLGNSPGNNVLHAGKAGQPDFRVTFTATGVTNEFPYFVNIPEDTLSIWYGQEFIQMVKIVDGDNDPVVATVEDKPFSAKFSVTSDPTQYMFQWTPQVNDRYGVRKLKFLVQDNQGGVGKDSLFIRVIGNYPPTLIYANELPATITKPDTVQFRVLAADPEGDNIVYTWYVDGKVVLQGKNSYMFITSHYSSEYHKISCTISDGEQQIEKIWYPLLTHVELGHFSATLKPYKGTTLEWQTQYEADNMGFQILRSSRENGDYRILTPDLIIPSPEGLYSYQDSTTEKAHDYYYKLKAFGSDGATQIYGPVKAEASLPETFKVYQNFPNPFNPDTKIRFQLPRSTHTRIIIYNVQGQQVRTLVDDQLSPGYHEIRWDALNENEKRVASGVYYYRIEADQFSTLKKMVLLK